jgi:hypothetical protein
MYKELLVVFSLTLFNSFLCMESTFEDTQRLPPEQIQVLLQEAEKSYGLSPHRLVFVDNPRIAGQITHSTIELNTDFIQKRNTDPCISSSFYGEDNVISILYHELAHDFDSSSLKKPLATYAGWLMDMGCSYLCTEMLLTRCRLFKPHQYPITVIIACASVLLLKTTIADTIERYFEKQTNLIDCEYLYRTNHIRPLCNRFAYLKAAMRLGIHHDSVHSTPQEEYDYRTQFLKTKGITVISTELPDKIQNCTHTIAGIITLKKIPTDTSLCQYPWHLAWKAK